MRVLVGMLIVLAMASLVFADITVTGSGTVLTKPDMVSFTVSVVTEDENAEVAVKENTLKSTKALKALDRLGIRKEHCETLGFSVKPNYIYPKDKPRQLVGYIVNNTFMVKIPLSSSATLGGVVGKAVVAVMDDGVLLNNIVFGVMDDKVLREKARVEAVKDARRKARTLAMTAGVNLGPAKSISESTVHHGIMKSSMDNGSVPIMAADQRITVKVNVTFHIVGEMRHLHNDDWD